MSVILFLLKHTPFWTVPVMLICGQFAYLYWLKEVRHISYMLASVIFLCMLITLFYIVAGGPDKAPEAFMRFLNS